MRVRRCLAALPLVALVATALVSTQAGADSAVFHQAGRVQLGGDHALDPPTSDYVTFRTDLDRARRVLAAATAEGTSFDLPRPDGSTQSFVVRPTEVMEPALAARQPQIQTFTGTAVDDPQTTVALDITQMGLHASVRSSDGSSWYVDPAYERVGTTVTVSYQTDPAAQIDQAAGLVEAGPIRAATSTRRTAVSGARAAADPVVTQHVYRLALTSDPTFAAYVGAANVDAEKATLVNRINQIYNDDLGIKLVLVADNDKLNFATSAQAYGTDGPCGGPACWAHAVGNPNDSDYRPDQLESCGYDTLGRNTAVIGQIIGADNYDVGHLILGTDGGGLAGLGVVGWSRKGDGCTGIPTPVGDYMAVDYMAHELGHEFGANHSFTGCDANRNGPTSVEPGSGSSIMGYAGICKADDLQNHSDPTFSQRSQTEITSYVASHLADSVEVQGVGLTGFGTGDTITLTYPGSGASYTLTEGVDYDAAHLRTAIADLTGADDLIITGWGFDPWGALWPDEPRTPADQHGFQVMFTAKQNPEDWPTDTVDLADLVVTGSTGVSATVSEISPGGPVSAAGQQVVTGNREPVVTAPAGFTVPTRTPFWLKAAASDPDNDAYTVLWEQNDRGVGGYNPQKLFDQTKTSGPLFRIFGTAASVSATDILTSPAPGQNRATARATRYLPNLAQVLADNTNAVTGRCPTSRGLQAKIDCFSEFLPTASYRGSIGGATRVMHFRATVRDRNPVGGGVAHDDVAVRVDPHAGPFLVTSQAKSGKHRAAASYRPGRLLKVTWKVNHTDTLSRRVRVLVFDVAQHTSVELVRTANDGSVTVRLPKRRIGAARIMVRAAHATWFDLSDRNFAIR